MSQTSNDKKSSYLNKLTKQSKFVTNEIIMETSGIRRKLHQFIDAIEDKKAEAIYTLFEDEINTDAQRKKLIKAERENFIRKEGKSYSWEEIKEMAFHKEKRHVL